MSGAAGLLRSFIEPGLRRQLALWIALFTLVGTVVVFYVVYTTTGDRLRSQIDSELAVDVGTLKQRLQSARPVTARHLDAVAERYVGGRASTNEPALLVSDVKGAGAGAGVVTNQPETFNAGQSERNEPALSRQGESREAIALLGAPSGYSTRQAPDVGDVRLLLEHVTLGQGVVATIAAGESLAAIQRTDRGLAAAFLLAGLIVVIGAMIAAAVIATRVSRPLRRMAGVAAVVDGGDLEPRMPVDTRDGVEVRVLTESFNKMLARLSEAFATQQTFIADASHELRTPLTVIRGQLEVLAAQPDPPAQEVRRTERVVQGEVARMSRLVEDLLLLANSEQPTFLRRVPLDLRSFVRDVWEATSHIADRNFELGPVASGILIADGDRLAQALRNLLANAVDYTAAPDGTIRLSVEPSGEGRVRFLVEDDGPGIPAAERERIFERFHRAATARRSSTGAGLGLSIVRAIAEGHGGTARAGESPLGGALIELDLPQFTAAPSTTPGLTPARS